MTGYEEREEDIRGRRTANCLKLQSKHFFFRAFSLYIDPSANNYMWPELRKAAIILLIAYIVIRIYI